ncbi:MAG: hypothetical protein ABFS19_01405 [Thermodesulfobacteriota bacterium]
MAASASDNSPIEAFRFLNLLILVLIAIVGLQEEFIAEFLIWENGPIETFTVVAYFSAVGALIISQRRQELNFDLCAALLILTMGLRELDFHDRFTTMGILKSRFYISPEVPLTEKLIALVIVVVIAAVALRFISRNGLSFLKGIRAGDKAALLVLNGIIFTILSKLIDSTPQLFARTVEEILEFSIPLFFLAALLVQTDRVWSESTHNGRSRKLKETP